MSENKCPHCGAEQTGRSHSGKKKKYACASWVPGDLEDRTRQCYEKELAALKALVRQLAELHRDGALPNSWAVQEILNNSQVKAIMEGE